MPPPDYDGDLYQESAGLCAGGLYGHTIVRRSIEDVDAGARAVTPLLSETYAMSPEFNRPSQQQPEHSRSPRSTLKLFHDVIVAAASAVRYDRLILRALKLVVSLGVTPEMTYSFQFADVYMAASLESGMSTDVALQDVGSLMLSTSTFEVYP